MLNKTALSIYFVVVSFLMLALVSTVNAQATMVGCIPAEFNATINVTNSIATYSVPITVAPSAS